VAIGRLETTTVKRGAGVNRAWLTCAFGVAQVLAQFLDADGAWEKNFLRARQGGKNGRGQELGVDECCT
jgi:hypothetical protein